MSPWAVLLPGVRGEYLGPYAGVALTVLMPLVVVLALAALVTGLALRERGIESLSRLGVASVVLSLSAHPFAFLTALPAFLQTRAALTWFLLGVTSTPMWFSWWIVIPIVVATWYVRELAPRPRDRSPVAPDGVWPAALRPTGG